MEYKFWTWRPPKFEKAEDMQKQIQEYLSSNIDKMNIKTYYDVKEVPVLTITWLVLYLGFADRSSFYKYEKKEEFRHTVRRARTFIENTYEKQLQSWNATWAIFALKNFWWKDIQTLEWEVNDNWERKFVIEHKKSKYENLDKDWNEQKDENDVV